MKGPLPPPNRPPPPKGGPSKRPPPPPRPPPKRPPRMKGGPRSSPGGPQSRPCDAEGRALVSCHAHGGPRGGRRASCSALAERKPLPGPCAAPIALDRGSRLPWATGYCLKGAMGSGRPSGGPGRCAWPAGREDYALGAAGMPTGPSMRPSTAGRSGAAPGGGAAARCADNGVVARAICCAAAACAGAASACGVPLLCCMPAPLHVLNARPAVAPGADSGRPAARRDAVRRRGACAARGRPPAGGTCGSQLS
jgi:hypothetical protein